MDLNFNKMPWYGQVGAFLALSLAGAGAFWNFYAQPVQAKIEARSAELSSLRADIDKGLATARRLPEFQKQVGDLELQLERLRAMLPEEKDIADLLRRIQGMATQSKLTIRAFTLKPVATKQIHAEWPISLQLEGTYHNLGGFLERVSKFPRIINVNAIDIRARDNQTESATVTAECTGTTFRLLERAAARPAAPGAPGAAGAPGAGPRPQPSS